jgi:hypothetical protein
MATHNGTRIPVLSAILRLGKFTAVQLCAETGFTRSQVGPILAELKADGFLESAPVAMAGPRPAHKPTSEYVLAGDPDKREQLAEEVRGFLVAAIRARPLDGGERLLQPAERELDELDRKLDAWELRATFGYRPAPPEVAVVRTRLEAVGDTLELAAAESGYTLTRIAQLLESSSPEKELPLPWVWKRWSDHTGRLERVERNIQMAEERIQGEVASTPVWASLGRRGRELPPELQLALAQYGDDPERRQLYISTMSLERASTAVSVPLVRRAYQGSQEPAALLTLTGLLDMQGKSKEARKGWMQWVSARNAPVFEGQLALAAAPVAGLAGHLTAIQHLCRDTPDCSLFTTDSEFLERMMLRPLDAMFPNLADPQQWIRPSESIRAQAKLYYACGFLLDRATFPGTPKLRLASGLWQCGYQPARAWSIAGGTKPDHLYFLFRAFDVPREEFEGHVRQAIEPIPGSTLLSAA